MLETWIELDQCEAYFVFDEGIRLHIPGPKTRAYILLRNGAYVRCHFFLSNRGNYSSEVTGNKQSLVVRRFM
jgi:hypothetical protein